LYFLDQQGHQRQFQDVGILDLERATQNSRPVLARSLALQVKVRAPALQTYINAILGNIITCDSALEVRQYPRAITANLIYYSEWVVRRMDPQRFQPWWIGERAQRSQIEDRQRKLQEVRDQLTALNEPLLQSRANEQRLDLRANLERLQTALAQPLHDQLLARELTEARTELAALDLDYAAELQNQIDSLESQITDDDQHVRKLERTIGQLTTEQGQLSSNLLAAQENVRQFATELTTVREKYEQDLLTEAEKLFQQRSSEDDLTQTIANTERALTQFTTQTSNHLRDHHDLGRDYNLNYQFAGIPDAPQDTHYLEEQQRLASTELPKYQEEIAKAREEASQELREHVLHLLRERINNAKQELKRMNDALRPLEFHGDRYRFVHQTATDTSDFYRLIEESQVIGTGSLFESDFYNTNKETFDRFYEAITGQSQDQYTQALRNKLVDYRTYLTYDIEMTRNGETSLLSRIMGQQSGGETQTPFYVAIAASFVQLYGIQVGEHTRTTRADRPTIRLAVFDEAFNQMDQDRIGATLDLFRSYGLQVITATPLERCEYLAPKMCTSLVLTGVGDSVLVEEYRNYTARLRDNIALEAEADAMPHLTPTGLFEGAD
jgi:uncharacterized protein YPO0396